MENKNEIEEDEDEDEDKVAAESSAMISLQNSRGGYERIYMHKKRLGLTYVISYIFLMLLAQGYFVMQFVLRSQFYENVSEFATIYYGSYEEAINLMEAMDVYREFYHDPTTQMGRKVQLKSTVDTQWKALYKAQRDYKSVCP